MNHADLPEVLEITFEAILPGRQQHHRRYTKYPTGLKFLAETTTMPSDIGKLLRVDFCGSSEEPDCENHERANMLFCRAKVRLSAGRNFADMLKDQEQRQATSLQAASYIAYACSPDSDRPGIMQVEMLVHAKASKNIRRGTLVGWLADSVEHLEAETISQAATDRTILCRDGEPGLGRSPSTAKGPWRFTSPRART